MVSLGSADCNMTCKAGTHKCHTKTVRAAGDKTFSDTLHVISKMSAQAVKFCMFWLHETCASCLLRIVTKCSNSCLDCTVCTSYLMSQQGLQEKLLSCYFSEIFSTRL